ncbi:MAG: hypothetical protein DME30_08820 [Verrucomicrobia bacterium]|nr:MAG: hypothetical protein DME30_08820 [Verrucomicrobiota bacterium]
MLRCIDDLDLALVFDVAVNTICIGGGELRVAIKRDGADYLCCFCVYHRRRISRVIKNIEFATTRLVNQRIGICGGVDLRNRLERT